MPSLLEDPTTYIPPSPSAQHASKALLPSTRTLKDNCAVTLYPIAHGPASVPPGLLTVLHREFSEEIARGTTYPMEEALERDAFAGYWFGTFAVVAVLERLGDPGTRSEMVDGRWKGLWEGAEERDWAGDCLGTFYVKPNYPGRCSHVCNAGFLTTNAARGRGVGKVMGETYLDYAPKLGYKYSVFNLVFENNVASVKIWEKLGFQIIGRVPGAARLANSAELVDALIIGRELA